MFAATVLTFVHTFMLQTATQSLQPLSSVTAAPTATATSSGTAQASPLPPVASLCELGGAPALVAQANRPSAPVACSALTLSAVGLVLALGAGLTDATLEAASSLPTAVFCWQPQLPTAPDAFSAAAMSASVYPNLTSIFAAANDSGTTSRVGSVCWLGCAVPAASGPEAEAALLSSPELPATANNVLFGPPLFICDSDGTWAPAVAFKRETPAIAVTAKALRSHESTSAVTVDCALKQRQQIRSQLPVGSAANVSLPGGMSTSVSPSASATPFTANDPPLPLPRCFAAGPVAPPSVLKALSCGQYALLQWTLAAPPVWASPPMSALLQRFLLASPATPRTWAANSAVAVAQVASMDTVAATPAVAYRVILAAAVPFSAAAASGIAAAAFGASSISSPAAAAVRAIALPPAAALVDGLEAQPVSRRLPSLIGAVVVGSLPETVSLRAEGRASMTWDYGAALSRLTAQLVAAYGSPDTVFGATVTVSVLINIMGPARDGAAANATTAIPLLFGGKAVASSVHFASSCRFATVSVAPPPRTLSDARYVDLLAAPIRNDADASPTPTPSPALSAARTGAAFTTLLVSEMLPAASFTVTLPTAPAAGESVDVLCSLSPASLVEFVTLQPVYTQSVTAELYASMQPAAGALTFTASPRFRALPTAFENPPVQSGAVVCTMSSVMGSSGGTATLPLYADATPLRVPLKLLSTTWPLFGDAVREDNTTAALRSAWGRSSLLPDGTVARVPAGMPDGPVRLLLSMDDVAGVVRRYSLPASSVNPFVLTLSGETVLDLVADAWQWRNATAEAVWNVSASAATPTQHAPHVGFYAGTRVWLGRLECKVLGVSSDGQVLRIRTPSYQAECGQDPVEEAGVPCGSKGLVIVNPSLFSSADLAMLAMGGPDADALEAAALGLLDASVPSASPSSLPLPALGGSIGCPQFCPGAGGGLVPTVSAEMAARETGVSLIVAAAAPVTALSAAETVSRATSAAVPASSAGVTYTVACTGAQWLESPSIDVCLNITHPDSRRCPFGVGDRCRECPDHAVCPSGMRAWVEAGYWSSGEHSPVILSCAYPATRCVGHNAATGAAACAPGYTGFRCGSCASRYYPSPDGSGACEACPADPQPIDAARPMLLFLGVLAGIGLVMGVVVLLISWRVGGTIAGGLKRTLQFVLSVVGVLQLVIQIGRAAQPGLPPLLYRFYSALLLLQLEGVTLHPNCLKTLPFQQDIAEMAISLALMTALCLLFCNCRRLHTCNGGASRKKSTRRLLWRRAHPRVPVDAPVGCNVVGANAMRPSETTTRGDADKWLVCWRRSGERSKPFFRGVVFSLLTLLYATVANIVLRILPCETQSMRVVDYLQLRMDGATLRSQLGIDLSAVAAPCLDAYCERRNPWFDRSVRVSVMSSNPGFVCYESPHFAVAVVAWACLALYTLGYPLVTFLLLRRRLAQLMVREPLRQQYEMALLRDYTRRQAWAKAGGNAYTRCWRRLCVRVCCLGSRFVSTAAGHASPARGMRACCASACHSAATLGGDVAAVVGNPDIAAATEAFVQLVARISSEAATTPGTTTVAKQSTNPLSRKKSPPTQGNGGTRGGGAAAAAASGVVPVHRGPALTRGGADPLCAGTTGAVVRIGHGASPDDAPRRSNQLLSPSVDTDVGLAAIVVRVIPVVSHGATGRPTASKVQLPLTGVRRLLHPSAKAGVSRSSSEGTARSTGSQALTAVGETASNTVSVKDALRPIGARRQAGGGPPGAVVTANGLIDGNPSITRDASLAHFTDANYRASRYWVRQQDMAVLLVLGLLAAFWPRTADSGWCGGLLALTAAVLCTEAGVLVAQKPFKPEAHWMMLVRFATILQSLASALLNFANATKPLPITQADSSSSSPSGQNSSETPLAVSALSDLVFACSILLAVTLVVSFLLSLRQGARAEEADAQLVVAFQRAAGDDPSTLPGAVDPETNPVKSAATQSEESARQRNLRFNVAAGDEPVRERVSFNAQASRFGSRPRASPARSAGRGQPQRPQPQQPEAR